MFDRRQLIDIISRRRNDWLACITRVCLGSLTPIYRPVIGWKNRRFDRAIACDDREVVRKAEIPVISVGNLTTGGTGKTPLVIRIAQHLRSHELRVVIISRGYQGSQSAPTSRNDEALEMEFRLPDVPHLQDPDRHRMTTIAVEELESQVVILDDGFQHRQLHRDLDIVLIDATEPFGFDRLLPRGLLREPVGSLARAHLIVITRCQLATDQQLRSIETRIRSVAGSATIVRAATQVKSWIRHDGSEESLSHLADQPVFAFCGIGNPAGFLGTLEQLNTNVVEHRIFEDHHHFNREDIESLVNAARQSGAAALVCTHKDLVKIGVNQFQELPFFALLIDTEILQGEPEFFQKIDAVVAATSLSPQR